MGNPVIAEGSEVIRFFEERLITLIRVDSWLVSTNRRALTVRIDCVASAAADTFGEFGRNINSLHGCSDILGDHLRDVCFG